MKSSSALMLTTVQQLIAAITSAKSRAKFPQSRDVRSITTASAVTGAAGTAAAPLWTQVIAAGAVTGDLQILTVCPLPGTWPIVLVGYGAAGSEVVVGVFSNASTAVNANIARRRGPFINIPAGQRVAIAPLSVSSTAPTAAQAIVNYAVLL